MLAVIKLRLLGLKEDYKIMLVMALLALGMVYAFGAQSTNAYDRKIFITDLEKSSFTETFINEIHLQKGYQVVVVDLEDGQSELQNNAGLAQLVIPSDFSSELLLGKVNFRFISSKNDVDTLNLKNTINAVLTRLHANRLFADQTANVIHAINKDVSKNQLADSLYKKVDDRYKNQNPYQLKELTISGGWTDQTAMMHRFYGFALLFSAYTIVFGIGEILNDKANHTWERLLQSPVSTTSILFGNTVTTLLVGILQMAIIFIGGQVLFGIDLGGNIMVILFICTAYIFSLTGMGLMLVSVLKNHGQLSAITPILLTSFAMLGGCLWPLEIVTSKVLLGLSVITPHRWALEALENVTLKGESISSSGMAISILLVMGLLYMVIGGLLINRRQAI